MEEQRGQQGEGGETAHKCFACKNLKNLGHLALPTLLYSGNPKLFAVLLQLWRQLDACVCR